MPSDKENALDASGAARILGVHVETVRRLARKGEIPSYKVGKDWRFNKEALEYWTETHHVRQESSKILVVDDEKSVRQTVCIFLEAAKYMVKSAPNGEEALNIAKDDLPDLVLLDLLMPGMSGVDVLRELHLMDPDIPVVIITAYPDGDLMAEALRYPPVTLLPKPVDKATLLKTVSRVLKGSGGK